ncbi:MAG: hypothetical protein H0T75_05860 [Rhizobiales bacterium]|nr:hypothetical protein [Hyphomicrobiales bacterium]
MLASADEWEGLRTRDSVEVDVSESELVRLIKRLDASRYTLVSLEKDAENVLMIGGGQGRFIVYFIRERDCCIELYDPDKNHDKSALLIVGGQGGDYREDQIVDEESAITCAVTFLTTGMLDERFHWRET